MSSSLTEKGKIIKGFKATSPDMKCRGFEFKIGEWYEHDGEIEMCQEGFHFCPHMSGVWEYYPEDSRVFEVEAEVVLMEYEPGADLKYAAKRIRFVKEVEIGGIGNTGDRNTGSRNTGDGNTGYRNTGDRNTGYRNTGSGNTGYWNTGDRNTGYRNTGDWNTGSGNTGYWNTGNRNTGNWNTGSGNTGDGNACDYSSGFFCQNIQTVKCFDKDTKMLRDKFNAKHGDMAYDLSIALSKDDPFDYEYYKPLPNWTLRKIKSLHKKHIKGRE